MSSAAAASATSSPRCVGRAGLAAFVWEQANNLPEPQRAAAVRLLAVQTASHTSTAGAAFDLAAFLCLRAADCGSCAAFTPRALERLLPQH